MVCQAYYIVWREIMNKQKFHNVMKWIIFVIIYVSAYIRCILC